MTCRIISAGAAFVFLASCQGDHHEEIKVEGLRQRVEVLRDTVGVNHIYAENEHDLFFAQGYCAARDRLFQFEIWRRQATGTLAEILGPDELDRDIGARLFKFRGNLKAELNHYHPRGEEIIHAFTEGINAYIRETEVDTSLLTLEFRLLGIRPGLWNPEDVISRHQGLLGNLPEEIRFSRAVAILGQERVKELVAFEPGDPSLLIDPVIDKSGLFDSIGLFYDAYKATVKFKPENLIASKRNQENFQALHREDEGSFRELMAHERESIGSNNWIVSGSRAESGLPLLANDPHRAITAPSLRYMVHLQAPGWNVLGGGEPTIPGVSIGHNENGAWGLTIFSLDGEDLYVYQLNPGNLNQYKHMGKWVDMTVMKETIPVKGQQSREVDLRYTQHGPLLHIDSARLVGYAVRCAWLEVGGAPYLASLRMDQAKTWEKFLEACSYSHIPGENMIWADRQGNIGWQAVGIAPRRKTHSGLVPVPGDGRYEWDNFLPIRSLPGKLNPPQGFLATANENNVPPEFPNREAVGWNWADRTRVERINEVLASNEKVTQKDMQQLQFDYVSIPARTLVPLLANVQSDQAMVEAFRTRLSKWNFTIDKNSVEASVYVTWEKKMGSVLRKQMVPESAQKYIRTIPLRKTIAWLTRSEVAFKSPADRNAFMIRCLEESVADLTTLLGPDTSKWVYGQVKMHHALIKHALSNAVDPETRKLLDAGPLPRSGYGSTPGMTANTSNQGSGASFRIVADVSDWDKTVFTNAPGQSGDPRSRYYRNLFQAWATDHHVPVFYSRDKVVRSASERTLLTP